MTAEGAERPLVTEVILFTVLVLDEFVILLVDGIVGQVHILVVFIDFRSVCLTSKSGKSLLENVDAQWLVTRHQNVNSQVKLVTVNQ
jgi:hypothetical protein